MPEADRLKMMSFSTCVMRPCLASDASLAASLAVLDRVLESSRFCKYCNAVAICGWRLLMSRPEGDFVLVAVAEGSSVVDFPMESFSRRSSARPAALGPARGLTNFCWEDDSFSDRSLICPAA